MRLLSCMTCKSSSYRHHLIARRIAIDCPSGDKIVWPGIRCQDFSIQGDVKVLCLQTTQMRTISSDSHS